MENQIWVKPKNEKERKEITNYLLSKSLEMKSQSKRYPIVVNVKEKNFISAGSTSVYGASIVSGGEMLDFEKLKEKLEEKTNEKKYITNK